MNASGKRINRAPFPAASAATSAIRSIVAARSKSTGSTWTQAAVRGSRLDARGRGWRPAGRTQPRLPRQRRGASLDERRPLERARAGDDRGGVGAEPLLEQRGVHAAEVGGRAEVAVVVEVVDARELADHLAAGARADQEARARRAVVGTAAVFLGSPAELRPDEREHAVGEPAGLEVA